MQLTDSHTNSDLVKIRIFVLNSLDCMGKQSQKENLDTQIAGKAIRREEPTDHQNVSEICG